MTIDIFWPWQLPQSLDSVVVVADIYAATTNISTFLSRKADSVYIVSEENVVKAKGLFKDAVVCGESQTLPQNFFDFGNYPHQVAKANLQGKTVLYMSNNGAKVIRQVMKKRAQRVITVSLRNFDSVASYLKTANLNKLSLVAAGDSGVKGNKALEDYLCLEAFEKSLKNESFEWDSLIEKAKTFISRNYYSEDFSGDFKVVFNLNKDNVVPSCMKVENDLIRIEDI